MNGLIAVRSMMASISTRADCSAPLMSSSVMASRLRMRITSRQRDDQIAVAVDLCRLVGKDQGGRIQLVDDGRATKGVTGEQRLASVGGDAVINRAVEAHDAVRVMLRCRAGGARDLRQRNLVDEANGAQPQRNHLDRHLAIRKGIELLMRGVEALDQAGGACRIEGALGRLQRQFKTLLGITQ